MPPIAAWDPRGRLTLHEVTSSSASSSATPRRELSPTELADLLEQIRRVAFAHVAVAARLRSRAWLSEGTSSSAEPGEREVPTLAAWRALQPSLTRWAGILERAGIARDELVAMREAPTHHASSEEATSAVVGQTDDDAPSESELLATAQRHALAIAQAIQRGDYSLARDAYDAAVATYTAIVRRYGELAGRLATAPQYARRIVTELGARAREMYTALQRIHAYLLGMGGSVLSSISGGLTIAIVLVVALWAMSNRRN